MIIEIRETEFLAEIDNAPVVVKAREHYLFGKWKYKTEELTNWKFYEKIKENTIYVLSEEEK